MLKKVSILFCFLALTGCYVPDIVPIEVERSSIYCGQTVVSLFENFGVPNSQHVDPSGIREYHYNPQRILKKGVDNYIYYCDFVVYTDDGIVVDWAFRGNRCAIETPEMNDWFISHEL